jgi:hypothetical protein
MKPRWGVHPVVEAALRHIDEGAVPPEIEDVLPARGRLSTRALVEIALLCVEHVEPRVARTQLADFERLRGLLARHLAAAPTDPEQPWQRDLHNARRDYEHGRGAVKIVALAVEIAGADLLRRAPGAGPEAVALTAEAVARTCRILSAEPATLHAFIRDLCLRVRAVSR